jgi:hypothetical protein
MNEGVEKPNGLSARLATVPFLARGLSQPRVVSSYLIPFGSAPKADLLVNGELESSI